MFHGPWDQSVSFCWNFSTRPNNCLNCLAFPPVVHWQPCTVPPLCPVIQSSVPGLIQTLAAPTLSYQNFSADTSVIPSSSSTPSHSESRLSLLSLEELSFHFKFASLCPSSSLVPTGERDLNLDHLCPELNQYELCMWLLFLWGWDAVYKSKSLSCGFCLMIVRHYQY